jgi:putative metal-binding protein
VPVNEAPTRRHPLGDLAARAVALGVMACGSRTDPDALVRPPALDVSGPRIQCLVDDDCEAKDRCLPQHCVEERCVEEPVECADEDPCTRDGCDPSSGLCVYESLTADEDGDGHHRPLPGFQPGAPGACGDDCNDTSSVASPEGVERCDGVDNDCDGVVDNGALFTPGAAPALWLSEGAQQASPGGLTFSDRDGLYGAVFTQRVSSSQSTFRNVQPGQAGKGPAVPVAEVNSDTFAGPIVGRGAIFATAWEDRRDDDYEIYFNRLNTRGDKLGPDLRVTRAPGFSLRPTLLELQTATSRAYRLAWEDERDGAGGRIYGQSFDGSGALLGDNVQLTPFGLDPSSPNLVAGNTRIGLLFNLATLDGRGLGFRSFDFDFGDGSDILRLGAQNPDAATITANAGRFVVAWHVVQDDTRPGRQIWGSVLSESGEELIPARALTEPAPFARYHSVVALGDRLILFWSEWHDSAYAIYSRELTPDLDPLGAARRVTAFSEEAYAPLATFGPQGEIGVMYTGQTAQSSQFQVLFTSMSCNSGADFSLPR